MKVLLGMTPGSSLLIYSITEMTFCNSTAQRTSVSILVGVDVG